MTDASERTPLIHQDITITRPHETLDGSVCTARALENIQTSEIVFDELGTLVWYSLPIFG